jgi:hypothetical protein
VSRAATSKAARGLLIACALAAGAVIAPRAGIAAGGMVLFIEVARDNPDPARPTGVVDTIDDLARALRDCWSPPPFDQNFGPVDVTFTVAFKRSGELFGKPKLVTFVQKVTPEMRGRYYTAVAETLDRCAQMPFTETMGGAVAGRVFRVNFLDKRNSKRAQASWPTTTTR